MSDDSYLRRGVSATKDDVHAAIKDSDAGLFPGAFCKIIPDSTDKPEYCSIMHADGAGTKSSVAYMQYKETGDASIFAGIAQDSLVMNLDDLMCVGAIDNFLVSNTIGRNAHRVPGHVIAHIIRGYEDFARTLHTHGINVTLTGGETADIGDLVSTVVVDSTIYTRLRRRDVIDCGTIRPGLVIVGLASFGQASYEATYNSGIGSNGLTAARHMLLSHTYARKYPESYSSTLQSADVYNGPFQLQDSLPGSQQTVGQAILSPTRTYLPVMKKIYEQHRKDISGVIHSSGGGQTKCKHFSKGIHYIKDNLFTTPPVFAALKATATMSEKEMYQVFNMGQRLEIYCTEASAASIMDIARSFMIDAQIIGRTKANDDSEVNKVTITGATGTLLEY